MWKNMELCGEERLERAVTPSWDQFSSSNLADYLITFSDSRVDSEGSYTLNFLHTIIITRQEPVNITPPFFGCLRNTVLLLLEVKFLCVHVQYVVCSSDWNINICQPLLILYPDYFYELKGHKFIEKSVAESQILRNSTPWRQTRLASRMWDNYLLLYYLIKEGHL